VLVFAPFDSLAPFLLFTRENTPTNEQDFCSPWKRGDNTILPFKVDSFNFYLSMADINSSFQSPVNHSFAKVFLLHILFLIYFIFFCNKE
jgi:hypothetical protein